MLNKPLLTECRCRACCRLRANGAPVLHVEPTADPYEAVTPYSIERARIAAQHERDALNADIFPRFGAWVDREGRYYASRVARECGQATPWLLLATFLFIALAVWGFGVWFDSMVASASPHWPMVR